MQKEVKDPANMNIFEKLAAVRQIVGALQKNKKGFGYTYTNEEAILPRITAGLDKYHLDYFPEFVAGSLSYEQIQIVKTKIKNEVTYDEKSVDFVVKGDMLIRWVNLDHPDEQYIVPWGMVGQQGDVSQGYGSGLTYCLRYFLLKFFKVPTTDDDPDKLVAQKREAEQREAIEQAREIAGMIDKLIAANITEENKTEVTTLVKKYARNKAGKPTANYLEIQDPQTAAITLEALKKFFTKAKGDK